MRWMLVLFMFLGSTAPTLVAAAEDRAKLLPQELYSSETVLAAMQDPDPDLQGALETGATKQKNTKLAMLYSLLLPGLGELYLGYGSRAAIFFVAEGAIWTSYAVFRHQGNHRKDLYKEYADLNAEASPTEDDDYYRLLANFIASEGAFSFNENVRRQARAFYPNDPAARDQYIQENVVTGDQAWQWKSVDSLLRFQEMRTSSLDAYERSNLSIGLLVANRLVSVVDVGLLGAKLNKQYQENESKLSWGLQPGPKGPEAQLALSRAF